MGKLLPVGFDMVTAPRIDPVKELKAWMDRMDITQCRAAEMIGVHEVYLSKVMTGDVRVPGLAIAFRIQDVTGIPARSWEQRGLNGADKTKRAKAFKRAFPQD